MSEQSEREKEIFSEALERSSPEARSEYVKGACGSDHALRERVEALLKAFESAVAFIPTRSGIAEEIPTVTVPAAPTEIPGTVIGRYKLLEKLGEGGFGVVYVAEQREPVKRRVALKIIKLGLDTRQVVARFEAERQALALMDHPNIAKVLDGGATETGRPYFVMELVRGIPITQYCDENHLSADARLKLFMLICQAIQHAHQKGIIHRDIKPSNILVTVNDGVPVPKVIDFGIAKATQGELTEKTVYTQFQQFIGTPAYMSPEQADMTSLDIDTRSDIYALGVLLYELLVGQTPFDAKELMASGIDAMRKTIREQEPVRPSTKLRQTLVAAEVTRRTAKSEIRNLKSEAESASSPRRLRIKETIRQLKGDVDWIVMKCLEKDRARRYETANGLAADIQRYLSNEPIAARPPSQLYRLQKFARRNTLVFTAGTSVAAMLALGVVVSTWQAIRATRAEREQMHQRNIAAEQRKLADMQLALQAWEEGDLERANDLIEASRPAPGQVPAFEWRYLKKLCQDQSITTFGTNDQYRSALFFDRDLLLLTDEKTLILHDLSRQKNQLLLEDQDGIHTAALCSGNTNLLATVTDNGRIKVWDLAARRVKVEFEGHSPSRTFITFSRDGRWLASASEDNSVKLWDVESRTLPPARTLRRYSDWACGVAFSSDGRQLFSCGSESMIRVWDVATGVEESVPLEGHRGWNYALAMSPDGLRMASGGSDSTVIVWNVISRKIEKRFMGHSALIVSLSFSPDGQSLASGGTDHTIRLWDMKTGQQLSLLRGHGAPVRSLTHSPDGQRLVSRGKDGRVKLWPATFGLEGDILTGGQSSLAGVALSPDGRHLASVGAADSTVDLWDLSTRSRTVLSASGMSSIQLEGHAVSGSSRRELGVATESQIPPPLEGIRSAHGESTHAERQGAVGSAYGSGSIKQQLVSGRNGRVLRQQKTATQTTGTV